MLVVDLSCAHGHRFEGWFGSADDLASQQARGLLTCPVCGDAQVTRLPSAARINTGHARPPADEGVLSSTPSSAPARVPTAPESPALDALVQMQKLWLEAARQIIEKTEDVGDQFAQEARRIHQGDAPERGIRGQVTTEEKIELQEEGIDVVSFPLPDALKKRLQ